MQKATTLPTAPRSTKKREVAIGAIQRNMQVVVHSLMTVRSHERTLRSAGVRLDRAGTALLSKLFHHREPTRISVLAEILGVDSPSVTRKVQQLERLGYVERVPDPKDGRATLIDLTSSGREVLSAVMSAHRDRMLRITAQWSHEELAMFADLLGKLANSIEEEMGTPDDR